MALNARLLLIALGSRRRLRAVTRAVSDQISPASVVHRSINKKEALNLCTAYDMAVIAHQSYKAQQDMAKKAETSDELIDQHRLINLRLNIFVASAVASGR